MKIKSIYSYSATVVLYATLLFYVTSLNRPDALGLLLFLSSIFIPWFYDYSYKSLIICIILGILAFYTKLYFILGVFYVISYVFLFISKKRGLIAGLLLLTAFTLCAFVINRVYECYFCNTLLVQYNTTLGGYWTYILLKQLVTFIRVNIGLVALFFFVAASTFFKYFEKIKTELIDFKFVDTISMLINYTNLDEPFFSKKTSLFFYCMILSFLVLISKMGAWGGAYMTYFFQLLSPFFILYIFSKIKFERNNIYLVAMPLILLSVYTTYSFKGNMDITSKDFDEWKKMRSIIAMHNNILNSIYIAPLLYQKDKKIYDTGQTYYAAYIAFTKPIMKNIFPNCDKMITQYENFKKEIRESLISKRFDLLILEKDRIRRSIQFDYIRNEDIIKNYYVVDSVSLYFPHIMERVDLEIWQQKK